MRDASGGTRPSLPPPETPTLVPQDSQAKFVTLAATAATVASVLPVFLLGASASVVRAELGMDEAQFGVVVAGFMGASATFAVLGGRVAQRLGARNGMSVAVAGSACTMLAVAVLVTSAWHLGAFLFMAGVLNSVTHPAGDLALARSSAARPGLMFGIKHAAVPAATLVGGAAVPLVVVTVGWRWVFVLGSVLAAGAASMSRALPHDGSPRGRPSAQRAGDAAIGPLLALSTAIGFAAAAAVSSGVYLVDSVVSGGGDVSLGGLLLVMGSLAGITGRTAAGWMVDRLEIRPLLSVAALLGLGAIGYLMIGLGSTPMLLIGVVLAFGCGFGWTGLVGLAVVRLNPSAPATASGIVALGGAAGGAIGPVVFGQVVTRGSYSAAWVTSAGAAAIAALLVLGARLWLSRDYDRRRHVGPRSDS